jgi:hypothetical protein
MMRGAERAAIGERAALDLACDRGDHRDFQQFRPMILKLLDNFNVACV